MMNGSLASLAVTLGSSREISRLHIAFENVTMESSHAPYSPGDDPGRSSPPATPRRRRSTPPSRAWALSPAASPGRCRSSTPRLKSGAEFPVTLQDARRSLELITALYASSDTGARVSLPIGSDHERYGNWTRKG